MLHYTLANTLFFSSMRALFQFSQQKVAEKFPNLAQQIIGGFFFLRFVCPALVTPERFGLNDPGKGTVPVLYINSQLINQP